MACPSDVMITIQANCDPAFGECGHTHPTDPVTVCLTDILREVSEVTDVEDVVNEVIQRLGGLL